MGDPVGEVAQTLGTQLQGKLEEGSLSTEHQWRTFKDVFKQSGWNVGSETTPLNDARNHRHI